MNYPIILLVLVVTIVTFFFAKAHLDESVYIAWRNGFNEGHDRATNDLKREVLVARELLAKQKEVNTNHWARGYGDASSEIMSAMISNPETYHKFIDHLIATQAPKG